MEVENPNMKGWTDMAFALDSFKDSVQIALIGKYTSLSDAYLSVIKSLKVSRHCVYALFQHFLSCLFPKYLIAPESNCTLFVT